MEYNKTKAKGYTLPYDTPHGQHMKRVKDITSNVSPTQTPCTLIFDRDIGSQNIRYDNTIILEGSDQVWNVTCISPAMAQSVGAWTGSCRVAGSSPRPDLKYGVRTATWRGPSSPPALPWCPWARHQTLLNLPLDGSSYYSLFRTCFGSQRMLFDSHLGCY